MRRDGCNRPLSCQMNWRFFKEDLLPATMCRDCSLRDEPTRRDASPKPWEAVNMYIVLFSQRPCPAVIYLPEAAFVEGEQVQHQEGA